MKKQCICVPGWRCKDPVVRRLRLLPVLLVLAISSRYGLAAEIAPLEDIIEPESLNLSDLSGTPHDLGMYRGQVVLVNFWATWCPPCLIEMPSLQRLGTAMAEQPFAILAVNVGEPRDTVWRFRNLLGFTFKTLLDRSGKVSKAWNVSVYPTSYLLDTDGQIRYVAYGAVEWDKETAMEIIERLLPENDPPSQRTTARLPDNHDL